MNRARWNLWLSALLSLSLAGAGWAEVGAWFCEGRACGPTPAVCCCEDPAAGEAQCDATPGPVADLGCASACGCVWVTQAVPGSLPAADAPHHAAPALLPAPWPAPARQAAVGAAPRPARGPPLSPGASPAAAPRGPPPPDTVVALLRPRPTYRRPPERVDASREAGGT